jgi:hypothetical protein
MTNRTLETQAAYDRALADLTRQVDLDPDLVVSEADEDGNVQLEGTVNLADLVVATLGTGQ